MDSLAARAARTDAQHADAQRAAVRDGAAAQSSPGAFCISEDERFITVSGRSFRYVFNRSTGLFDSICADNIPYLQKPMEYNIWRAPTDNDRNVRAQWELAGYDRHTAKVYASGAETRDDGDGNGEKAVITVSMSLSAVFVQRILEIEAEWAIDAGGALRFDIRARRDAFTPWLPRFGLRLFLPEAFGYAEYFGYGPHESYIDKRRASWLSSFGSTVDGLFEDYIRPQENGSRFGCSRLAIYSGADAGAGTSADAGADVGVGASSGALAVAAVSGAFSFNASRYTQEELAAKKHNFELERSGHTVLCLDYKMSGVGSNSCGPELLPQYRLSEPAFRWQAELAFGRR
jgi:beta-galactosidase